MFKTNRVLRLAIIGSAALVVSFGISTGVANAGGTPGDVHNVVGAHIDLKAGTATFKIVNSATMVGTAAYNCAPSGCADLSAQTMISGQSHIYEPSDVPYVIKLTDVCNQNDLFVGEPIPVLSNSNRYGPYLLDVAFGKNCEASTPTPTPTPTPTVTPTPTPTPSVTVTPTPTPTVTPSNTPTPTATPTKSHTTSPATHSPTPSRSELAHTGGTGDPMDGIKTLAFKASLIILLGIAVVIMTLRRPRGARQGG